MKSLLISSIYFPPQVGGISHLMADVASALGPDRICCLTGVRANDDRVPTDFKPRVYRRSLAFAKSNYLQALGWGTTITEIMFRERPKIVQLATVGEGYLGLWLKRWFGLPFVVYAHGNEILAALHNDYWLKPKLALKEAACILANSQFTASLVERVGVDSDNIEIVHPGCNVDRFRPRQSRIELRQRLLGRRYNTHVILTVGGLVARKGHDIVIRSLPYVRQRIPDITYLIVGEGPYRIELEKLAAAIGVRDRVVFAGEVSDADLPDVYALSEVFAMPSRELLEECVVEGFGIVFLEANACGKPVVGGRSGGIPDAIADGVNGFLVDPTDPKHIADVLIRLVEDRELAARMGAEGRKRVIREFNSGRIGEQVKGILDSVIARSNSGGMTLPSRIQKGTS
jgi:phosphatidylinositol alpha-1,6-mannosyltransferase